MALSDDRRTRIHGNIDHPYDAPVAAGVVIYIGALVSFNATGFLEPLQDNADQAGKHVGLALSRVTNTTGLDGHCRASVVWRGQFVVDAGPITEADRGKVAHATDDSTLSLTSTNSREVGVIQDVRGNLAVILSK